MFKLLDNRNYVYQWDTNVVVSIDDPRVKEAHFCNRTSDCSLVVEVKDGLANVPNIILQQNYDVKVFAYDGKATLFEQTIKVVGRTRPADYVYEETEIIRYEDISKRMNALEENLESTVVEEVTKYMEENPVNVDLNDYYTKEEVDTAIYDSKDAYYLDFINAPEGSANAVEATDDMAEFAERFKASKNVCVHIKETNPEGFNKWSPALISGVLNNIRLQVATTVAKGGHNTDFTYFEYHIKWSSSAGQWLMYKERLGETEFATKEYVDEALANLDIPEAEVDLSNYYTKEEVNTLLADMPSGGGGLTEEKVQDLIDATIASLDSDEVEY